MAFGPRNVGAAAPYRPAREATGGAPLDARARYGRLVWDAIRWALKNSCECESCRKLDQAFDAMAGPALGEVTGVAPGDNPPA